MVMSFFAIGTLDVEAGMCPPNHIDQRVGLSGGHVFLSDPTTKESAARRDNENKLSDAAGREVSAAGESRGKAPEKIQ